MTASSNRTITLGLLIGSLLLFLAGPELAAQEREAPERERPEVTPTSGEVIIAIKRRAQQILEARRATRRVRISKDASQLIGYSNNPSNGTEHLGDTYLETSLGVSLSKKLTPTTTWQGSYNGSFTNYIEYGDGDYTSQTIGLSKLTWQPGRMWRVDGGIDLNLTYYPKAGASNYREFKPSIGVRQNLWGSWFHSVRYEWFIRDYLSKKARDGNSAETLSNRVDARHRFRYELGTTWKEALLKIKQEWYLHDSNDARVDFYDAQDYKVTASVNRPLTKKLSLNGSYAFERKNYEHRTVTGNVTAEARYDDTQTWTLGGSYEIDKMWSLNPNFSYKFLSSNEPTGEYIETIGSATLTARF